MTRCHYCGLQPLPLVHTVHDLDQGRYVFRSACADCAGQIESRWSSDPEHPDPWDSLRLHLHQLHLALLKNPLVCWVLVSLEDMALDIGKGMDQVIEWSMDHYLVLALVILALLYLAAQI